MKNFVNLILAGIIGGAIVLLTMGQQGEESHSVPQYAKQVSNNLNVSPSAVPSVDFVNASSKATEAVVHIYAEESDQLALQRREEERNQRRDRRRGNDPFAEFFGGGNFFGGDIFGQNFFRPKKGTGSGVIISNDGYIVTNNHVVGFADYIQVTLADGRKVEATKIGTDPSTDLAVLKIETDNLMSISYGDSDEVKVGEWVLAVGNPFDLTSTVTAGIISAKGRDLDIIKGNKAIEEFIQTDAAVNPGNSGGALVNTDGQLIGINTAIATPTGVYAGYSFAIPANLVKRIVTDIKENGGTIERTNLGVSIYDIDDDLKNELNLSVSKGVYVDEVQKGSAAQFAGVLPGDVITSIDGQKVDNYDDLSKVMKFKKVGDTVEMGIVRQKKKRKIQVRLKKGI
jgi:Do/DeqQ family serine protease